MGKFVLLDSQPSTSHMHKGLKLTSILSKPTAPRARASHPSCISHRGTTGIVGESGSSWIGISCILKDIYHPSPFLVNTRSSSQSLGKSKIPHFWLPFWDCPQFL